MPKFDNRDKDPFMSSADARDLLAAGRGIGAGAWLAATQTGTAVARVELATLSVAAHK